MNLNQLTSRMRTEFFHAGIPQWLNKQDVTIDASVCDEAICENCKHEGLYYLPYHKRHPRTYRAFAHCHACNNVTEF